MPCTHPLSAACPAETQSAAPTCVCVLRHGTHVAQVSNRASRSAPGCESTCGLTWAPVAQLGTHLRVPAVMPGRAHLQTQRCVLKVGRCVHMCVLCARVCAHTQVPGTGMHTRVCTAHGASLGVRVGGQHTCGLACAVPRHHQMVPCLRGTFRGHKPAPCTGTWGWFMRGHRPLCQAEPASTARGE